MSRLEFKRIELSDRELAEECLRKAGFRGCEYTFGNNFAWRRVFGTECAFFGEFYFLKFGKGANMKFTVPTGGDIAEGIALLREYCTENGLPLHILADKPRTEQICGLFPEARAEYNRDSSDYVYLAEELATLRGKKFHAKRNHLNRFYENDWSFEPLSKDNIHECAEMNERWISENIAADDPLAEEKLEEESVVKCGFKHFSDLDYVGGVIRVNGEVQAFCFGEPSPSGDCFVVHVEKALRNYQGAYAAINCEFVKSLGGKYKYINREEDTGAENLRKAKLSYNPVFLEDKYDIYFGG